MIFTKAKDFFYIYSLYVEMHLARSRIGFLFFMWPYYKGAGAKMSRLALA